MKGLRAAVFALLLGALAPAHAVVNGSEKSQRLVSEGNALIVQRQYKAASDKFEEARKDSPDASSPLSSFAYMLYTLAAGGTSPEAKAQLDRAREWAHKALNLSSDDPLANEVLRLLEDDTPKPEYVANPAATALFNEGEVLFHNGSYDAARLKYRAAYQADSKYAKALLMEGDCYFMEKNWAGAELLFKMATESAPLDDQAWRFLADARARMGDGEGSLGAVLHAIAALPSHSGNWERLKAYAEGSGRPMSRLALQRKAWVTREASSGKFEVTLSSEFAGGKGGTDGTIWLAYAMAEVAVPEDIKRETPFQKELRAWGMALGVATELEAQGKPAPNEPALRNLQKLHAAGQLEIAIMLLMYKEAYRAEFETWKKQNPNGVADFTNKWRLMP